MYLWLFSGGFTVLLVVVIVVLLLGVDDDDIRRLACSAQCFLPGRQFTFRGLNLLLVLRHLCQLLLPFLLLLLSRQSRHFLPLFFLLHQSLCFSLICLLLFHQSILKVGYGVGA